MSSSIKGVVHYNEMPDFVLCMAYNCRLQISCNSLVQSPISSAVETATNQSLAAINMYYKRYQKPDKERYRVFKQDCRHITLLQIVCYC